MGFGSFPEGDVNWRLGVFHVRENILSREILQVFLAEANTQAFLQLGKDRLMSGVDFLGFQRPLGGAVAQAVGDRLAVGRELFAAWIAEEVEALERGQEGFLALSENFLDLGIE